MYNTPFCRVCNTRFEKIKDSKSVTEPGQAYPVRTLVERFATGQALGIAKIPQFIDDATLDSPDLRFTDITERDEALAANAQLITTLKGDIDGKVAKYRDKLIKEQIEKEKKQQENTQTTAK